MEIDKMSTADHIPAMARLWENLIVKENEMASPVWHERILCTRMQKIK